MTNALLRVGTEVPLRLSQELTTQGKKLRVGDRFHLETSEPVMVQGVNVIPVGSPAVGEITDARNKGMWGKSGHLAARVLYVTVNGRQIRLSGAFDDKGNVVQTRRKLKPTHVERTVFGEGDGSHLAVMETEIGNIGSLCCWEHLQPLTKYAMYSQNEQIHVAAWPSFSLYRGAAYALGPELNNAASQMYAAEGQCFVLAPSALVSKEMHALLCTDELKRQLLLTGGGFTRIYAPDGSPLVPASVRRWAS